MTTTPYAPPAQPQPQPQQKSGCLKWTLIGCGVIIVLCVAFVAVVGVGAFGAFTGVIKHSAVYRTALQRAQSDPRVIAALGSPVEAGFLVSGSLHADNGSGNAELNFPIHGPKQKGKVHVVATLENGQWKYETLTVQPESGPLIDLNSSP